MRYRINKSLIQEEMSPFAKNGAKLLGAGGAVALAHAGTFGTGVKNLVDGAGNSVAGMGQTAGHKIGTSLNDAGKFYGQKDNNPVVTPAEINQTKNEVETKTIKDASIANNEKPVPDSIPEDTEDTEGSIGAKISHHLSDNMGKYIGGAGAALGIAALAKGLGSKRKKI